MIPRAIVDAIQNMLRNTQRAHEEHIRDAQRTHEGHTQNTCHTRDTHNLQVIKISVIEEVMTGALQLLLDGRTAVTLKGEAVHLHLALVVLREHACVYACVRTRVLYVEKAPCYI